MDPAQGHPYDQLNRGDREVCEDFVRAEYAGLHRWFLWLTRDTDRAADLTQEAFTSFWHSLKRTRPETSPRVWLYAIARNVWRKHCRQRQRQRSREQEAMLDEIGGHEQNPFTSAEGHEFVAALGKAVENLPDDYREIFTLRVWQEMEYEEIAEIQGISRDLARWRFFRARQLIRGQLQSWQLQEEHHGP